MGHGQSSIPADELRALLELYDALGGERWRRRTGWKQPTADPETWFGVEVMLGHVVALELPANELIGVLPPALERLPHLRVLNLSKNKLHGVCVCVYTYVTTGATTLDFPSSHACAQANYQRRSGVSQCSGVWISAATTSLVRF